MSRMPYKQPNGVVVGGGGPGTTDPAMELEVMRLAAELCSYDWNRKPRGPKKGNKTSASSVAAEESRMHLSKKEAEARGAPRSQISAGNAYVSALQSRPPNNSVVIPDPLHVQQASSSASLPLRAFPPPAPAPPLQPPARMQNESHPSHFRVPSYPSSSYQHVAAPPIDPRLHSPDSGQYQPPSWQTGRMPSADSVLTPSRSHSYQRQPLSGFVATAPLWLPTSPSNNPRSTLRSLMGSNASSPSSSAASSHSASRNNSLRPTPSIPNDPFHPSLNWHGSSHDKESDADIRLPQLSNWTPSTLPFHDNDAPRTRAAVLVEVSLHPVSMLLPSYVADTMFEATARSSYRR